MRRMWRSYFAFVPMLGRVVLFGLLPLVILGIGWYLGGRYLIILYTITEVLVLTAVIMTDNWSFGGIYRRDIGLPEYAKTSPNGRRFFGNALTMAGIVPLILTGGMLFLWMLFTLLGAVEPSISWEGLLLAAELLCITEALALMGCTVSRFFDSIWINILIAYVATMLQGGWAILIGLWSTQMNGLPLMPLVVSAVLMVAAAFLYARVYRWRVEGSYYDERS